ncbi:unnamed protein product [Toxocara canis]|uniref:DUF5753 domain-containing protein n=1 Tax=Toxocara canis TaxID=6265 RepID=A0A183VDR4_TOXCA|nr:unnamed protein product [Toxocara canis]
MRPCISTRTSRSDGEFITQTVVSQRDTRRRERNQRRRRSRTISSTTRIQPTMEMPPIQLISELGDFPEIIIVRTGGELPKYEDAIKLKDTAPPAYTPTAVREDGLPPAYERSTAVSETSHEAAAVSEPRYDAAAVSDLRYDEPQSSRWLRRAHSLPDT